MSVTVNSRPDDFSSAYTPVEYDFSSTFAGRNGTFSAVEEDANGKAIFIVAGFGRARNTKVDGVLTITNSDNYDGEWTVIDSANGGRVTVDLDYVGTDSGNASYTRLNMHMICDLYIDGNFIVRKTRYPDLNDRFVFNFDREIQINLGNDLAPLTLGSATAVVSAPSSASIYVKYVESEDIITDGVAVQTLNLGADGELTNDSAQSRTIINSTVPYLEWQLGSTKNTIISKDTDLTDFVTDASSSARFLTNSPKTISIGADDSYQLSAIIDYDSGITYRRKVTWYDSAGTPTSVGTAFSPGADGVWAIPCGTRDLSLAQLPANAVKYDVSISNTSTSITEIITFVIDSKCHGSKTRFVWLNPRGGYDAYNFYSPRKLNSSVQKKSYQAARTYPVVVGNREESIIDVNSKDVLTVSTNKVTTEVAEWLQELLESPEVYIELDSDNALHDTRVPVTLVNKTRAISNSYDTLHNVSLRYRFGFDKVQIRAS